MSPLLCSALHLTCDVVQGTLPASMSSMTSLIAFLIFDLSTMIGLPGGVHGPFGVLAIWLATAHTTHSFID